VPISWVAHRSDAMSSTRAIKRTKRCSSENEHDPPAKIYCTSAEAASDQVGRLERWEIAQQAWKQFDARFDGSRRAVCNLSELSVQKFASLPPLVRPAPKRPPSSASCWDSISTLSRTESATSREMFQYRTRGSEDKR
jgi:hypothetical protein